MALTVGDGPNRGKSAPPPKRLGRPAPKPKPQERSRPRTPAQAISEGSTRVGFSDRPQGRVQEFDWNSIRRPGVTHPPAIAPRGREAQRLYNEPIIADENRRAGADNVASMYNNMASRQKKDELRIQREKADRSESGKAMTSEQWAALSPLQQAAVQANADLASAVARDFKTQGTHANKGEDGTARVQQYMKQVKDLFGEDGTVGFKGLEFAPNTVAFLNERGLGKDDLSGRTLDDLVSGDTLFTNDQIAELGTVAKHGYGKAVFETPDPDQTFVENVAKGQLQYQEDLANKLAKGNQLLTGMTGQQTSRVAGQQYGALQDEGPKFDAIQPQTMQQIDMYMEALARPDSPIPDALKAINLDLMQRGVSTKEAEQVWQALTERSRMGATGEGKWFDSLDFPMRSPGEVGAALGSPTLKRLNAPPPSGG